MSKSKSVLIKQILNSIFPPVAKNTLSHDQITELTTIKMKEVRKFLPKITGFKVREELLENRILHFGDTYHTGLHAFDIENESGWVAEVQYVNAKGLVIVARVKYADLPPLVEKYAKLKEYIGPNNLSKRNDIESKLESLSCKEICSIFEIDMKKFVLNGLTEDQLQKIKESFQ